MPRVGYTLATSKMLTKAHIFKPLNSCNNVPCKGDGIKRMIDLSAEEGQGMTGLRFVRTGVLLLCILFVSTAYTWEGTIEVDEGVYTGEIFAKKPHGYGVLKTSTGDTFTGTFSNGSLENGTFTFADGREYVGEFKDDLKHGQGAFTFPDGDQYVGEWKDDLKHGQGTYTFANGAQYIGAWRDDSFWEGVYYDVDGNPVTSHMEGVQITDQDSHAVTYCRSMDGTHAWDTDSRDCRPGTEISQDEFEQIHFEKMEVWCVYNTAIERLSSSACNDKQGLEYKTLFEANRMLTELESTDLIDQPSKEKYLHTIELYPGLNMQYASGRFNLETYSGIVEDALLTFADGETCEADFISSHSDVDDTLEIVIIKDIEIRNIRCTTRDEYFSIKSFQLQDLPLRQFEGIGNLFELATDPIEVIDQLDLGLLAIRQIDFHSNEGMVAIHRILLEQLKDGFLQRFQIDGLAIADQDATWSGALDNLEATHIPLGSPVLNLDRVLDQSVRFDGLSIITSPIKILLGSWEYPKPSLSEDAFIYQTDLNNLVIQKGVAPPAEIEELFDQINNKSLVVNMEFNVESVFPENSDIKTNIGFIVSVSSIFDLLLHITLINPEYARAEFVSLFDYSALFSSDVRTLYSSSARDDSYKNDAMVGLFTSLSRLATLTSIKNAKLSLSNESLLDIFFSLIAKQQGVAESELKIDFANDLFEFLTAMGVGLEIQSALVSTIAEPGTLTVTIKPSRPLSLIGMGVLGDIDMLNLEVKFKPD